MAKRGMRIGRKPTPEPLPPGGNNMQDAAAQVVRDIYEQRRKQIAATQSQTVSVVPHPIRFEEAVKPRYAEAMKRIDEIERLLEQISAVPPGIGHNQPPPLDRIELDEIRRDIAALKALPPVLQPSQVFEVKSVASKWRERADRIVTALTVEGAKEAAKYFWPHLRDALIAAAKALANWFGLW